MSKIHWKLEDVPLKRPEKKKSCVADEATEVQSSDESRCRTDRMSFWQWFYPWPYHSIPVCLARSCRAGQYRHVLGTHWEQSSEPAARALGAGPCSWTSS